LLDEHGQARDGKGPEVIINGSFFRAACKAFHQSGNSFLVYMRERTTTGPDAGIEVYDVEQNMKWRFAPNEEGAR
jgi:hypothetical protein